MLHFLKCIFNECLLLCYFMVIPPNTPPKANRTKQNKTKQKTTKIRNFSDLKTKIGKER